MADPNDLLEQLRLKRLQLLQDEQNRRLDRLSELDRISPANLGPITSSAGYAIPSTTEDWDHRMTTNDYLDRQQMLRNLSTTTKDREELEQLPSRFQQLFTPMKDSK